MTDAKRLADDVIWIHRFINSVPFGANAPASDIQRAHEIVESLRAQQDGVVKFECKLSTPPYCARWCGSGECSTAAAATTDNICEHCGGKVSSYPKGCPKCGAPQCCQRCCDATDNAGGQGVTFCPNCNGTGYVNAGGQEVETDGVTSHSPGPESVTDVESTVPVPPAPDELVKRFVDNTVAEVKAYIKELLAQHEADKRRIAELEQYDVRKLSICEAGAFNPSILEYMKHWEDRAEKAEREARL